MAKSTAFVLSKKSQEAFLQYYREMGLTVDEVKSSQRRRFEEIDRAYQREQNDTDEHIQATLQNKAHNPNPIHDVTVPIVMPQVEAAVTYQSSVFLTGVPIFGVVSTAENMDAAMQMETVLEQNATKGGWTKELMMFFRDGSKYNFAPIEVTWETEKTVSLVTDVAFSTTEGKPVETIWAGNSLKRRDPYNTFVDPRVAPSEVYEKGEFAWYTEYVSRIELKQYIAELSDTIVQNVTEAFNSASLTRPGTSGETVEDYYVPNINPDVNISDNYDGGVNWLSWAELASDKASGKNSIEYKDSYQRTTLYCKILPSEFGLNVPGRNTPQVWKVVIINHSVIIHAERQTNAHGWIPIFIGQPNEDGLDYQTKSLATNAIPFQEVTTAFMQSILASRRRAISDRTLYDPSRVLAAHINSENPSAKIPVRPSAYGKNISDAVYQFPYREDQAQFSMQQISQLITMANQLNGQNPARQGQFVKGNKTREEFEQIMGNASGRDQMVAILYEVQIFSKIKQVFKLNILQYQGAETIYSQAKEQTVDVDPVQLRNAVLEFKISDGLVPSDKIINADAWKVALQVLGSSQLGAGYRINELFSYLMKTQGAKINEFEKSPEQIAYEQALNTWASLQQLAIEKGIDPATLNIGERPLPEEFGYNPNPQKQGETIEGESQLTSVG